MRTLSARMEAVLALCKSGNCAADIGCDHGFVSIRLVQDGIFGRVLAMDLREGPLSAARKHIQEEGLQGRIECRLSDGLEALHKGEADALVCAGMGGELMKNILEREREKLSGIRQLVLQPQSEVAGLRRYLKREGYEIEAEDIVLEDGKFYPMFRAVPAGDMAESAQEELFDYYGKQTLEGRHPVLRLFLERQERIARDLKEQLPENSEKERIRQRLNEVEEELLRIQKAMTYFN